jgi:hypothetical protein
MTAKDVEKIVRTEGEGHLSTVSHGITLEQALVRPKQIVIIDRIVQHGRMTDKELSVWLVGKERSDGGYMIVMREKDRIFGLASQGFPTDQHSILTGWYGNLVSIFEGM